jgi:uncharacterized membrane protein YfcA
MPWWAVAYIIVLAGVGVIGVLDDLKEGEEVWYVVLAIASVLFCVVFVIAWFHADLAAFLGKLVLPMLLLSVAFNLMSATEDLRKMKLDTEFASRGSRWIPGAAIMIVTLLDLPAYYCAVGLSVRAWYGSP